MLCVYPNVTMNMNICISLTDKIPPGVQSTLVRTSCTVQLYVILYWDLGSVQQIQILILSTPPSSLCRNPEGVCEQSAGVSWSAPGGDQPWGDSRLPCPQTTGYL